SDEGRTRTEATVASHQRATSATVDAPVNDVVAGDGGVDSSAAANASTRRCKASSRVRPRTRRGRLSPGTRHVARHRPSAARYSDPSPFEAFPLTVKVPSADLTRLPLGALATPLRAARRGSYRELRRE